MMHELAEKVMVASKTDVTSWKKVAFSLDHVQKHQKALQESSDKVIAIGASTGGTVALTSIIQKFAPTIPGVVVVQHMPPVFTKMFADKLNDVSQVEVKEAEDGDRILTGRVLIAPGGMHLTVARSGGRYLVHCKPGPPVSGHCPSVDVLMGSVAESVGANAVGAILTGMGSDGADGMKQMRDAGARTLAQDEASCVVFGMPKQAHQNGGAERLVPLDRIARTLTELSQELVR
jgi:two-component system chemotaxis response regulator CheB